jgi:cupin 2 domain-containing protein
MTGDSIFSTGNLYADIPLEMPEELSQILWQTSCLRVERIVSRGQVTPEGQWYDQAEDEWVVLLTGAARVRIEGQDESVDMRPGDFVLLSAHVRHRVEWTALDCDTVWLAVFARL